MGKCHLHETFHHYAIINPSVFVAFYEDKKHLFFRLTAVFLNDIYLDDETLHIVYPVFSNLSIENKKTHFFFTKGVPSTVDGIFFR